MAQPLADRLSSADHLAVATGIRNSTAGVSQAWAMLIKRVYEIDPMACPECGGVMKVAAFIEPPQGNVIEKILRHCGLWCPASPRAPPAGDLRVHDPDGNWESDLAYQEPRELTFVDEATFWATF